MLEDQEVLISNTFILIYTMADLLITTTPILSGVEIKRYIGPITANVVLGV